MKEGTTVTGSDGKRYRVEQYLGEGVTSQVYKAVDEATDEAVALKVLRPEVSQIIIENFWQEGQILGKLARAEEKAGDGLRNVPRVRDSQHKGAVRFLALELVKGTALDRLLEKQRFLEEQEALFVANQVLRVLVLLHEEVRRTYTDFQLQNIWLEHGEDGTIQGVKVMDWNHVSDKHPEQPLPDGFGAGDLARFGAYFYRMLTGKGANERGETERALERRAGEQWEAVSVGTRQIVLRALHPDPKRRFTSAAEFRQAVQTQQELWQTDPVSLLGDVAKIMPPTILGPEQSEISKLPLETKQAEQIKAMLDMAERLGSDAEVAHVNHYRQRLEPVVGSISVIWKSGEQYYKAKLYQEAADKWREEAEAQGRVELWRWVMLAEAAVELGREVFTLVREQAEEAVQALGDNQLKRAREILEELLKGYWNCSQLKALASEAVARDMVLTAEEQEISDEVDAWENAAKTYRNAETALQTIPYADLIREEEGWFGLTTRAEELEKKARERLQTDKVETQVRDLLRLNFKLGRQKLNKQLQRYPTHQGLVQLCLDEAQTRLAHHPKQAVALLDIAVLFAQVPELNDELRQTWLQALSAVRKQEEEQRTAWLLQEEEERTARLLEAEKERAEAEHKRQQKLAEAQRKHQQELAEAKRKRVAAQRKREQERVAAQRKQEQELTEQRRAEEAKRLNEIEDELQQVLKRGQWHEIHHLVGKIPPGSVHPRWQELRQRIRSRFDEALESWELPVAQELMEVLAVLEEGGEKHRQLRYKKMVKQIKDERAEWESKLLPWIERQRLEQTSVEDHEALRERINRLLPFIKDNELKTKLINKCEELEEASRHGKGKVLIEEAHCDLKKLTSDGLADAKLKFEQAQKLLASSTDEKALQQVEKGLKATNQLRMAVEMIDKAETYLRGADEQRATSQPDWRETLGRALERLEEAEWIIKERWRESLGESPPVFERMSKLRDVEVQLRKNSFLTSRFTPSSESSDSQASASSDQTEPEEVETETETNSSEAEQTESWWTKLWQGTISVPKKAIIVFVGLIIIIVLLLAVLNGYNANL